MKPTRNFKHPPPNKVFVDRKKEMWKEPTLEEKEENQQYWREQYCSDYGHKWQGTNTCTRCGKERVECLHENLVETGANLHVGGKAYGLFHCLTCGKDISKEIAPVGAVL